MPRYARGGVESPSTRGCTVRTRHPVASCQSTNSKERLELFHTFLRTLPLNFCTLLIPTSTRALGHLIAPSFAICCRRKSQHAYVGASWTGTHNLKGGCFIGTNEPCICLSPQPLRPRGMPMYIPPDWVMELPDIRRAIHHLVNDSNPDVRHFVSFLPPILGHDLSQEDKVHAKRERKRETYGRI